MVKPKIPAALPLGKTRCPLYRRLGESQGPSGRVRNISSLPGFDPRTVQLITVTIPTELSRILYCVITCTHGDCNNEWFPSTTCLDL